MLVVLGLISYFVGCIPWGLWINRWAGLGDVRHYGSGNIGASNVWRHGGAFLGALTFLGDALKGASVVMLGMLVYPKWALWLGLACVLGHCFPVFLKFRGGKGVATAAGAIAVVWWPACILALGLWWLMVRIWAVPSMASLVGLLSVLGLFAYGGPQGSIMPLILISSVILWRHKDNWKRLYQGKELAVSSRRGNNLS